MITTVFPHVLSFLGVTTPVTAPMRPDRMSRPDRPGPGNHAYRGARTAIRHLALTGAIAALVVTATGCGGDDGPGDSPGADDGELTTDGDNGDALGISMDLSSLSVDGEGVVADGVDAASVELLLRDEADAPVAGVTVTLAASGGDVKLDPADGATDEEGRLTASLTSTVAETKTVTAELGDDGAELSGTITFEAGPLSQTASSLEADPDVAAADGEEEVVLRAIARDAHDNPVSGIPVAFSTAAGDSFIETDAGTTGDAGSFTSPVTSTAIGTATLTADFGDGSFSFDVDVDFQPPPPEILLQSMAEAEIGDSGPMRIAGFGNPYIGAAGDMTLNISFRDAIDHSFVSNSTSYFLLRAGAEEAEPYFSRFIEAPDFPEHHLGGDVTPHGPADDGSVAAMVILDDDPYTEVAGYLYHDGEYEVLFHRYDVPGLPDHTLLYVSGSPRPFARNRHGEWAVRLSLCDNVGDDGCGWGAWLRGDDDGIEPVMLWGDSTGITDPEFELDYHFYWMNIRSRGNTDPSINSQGKIAFAANTRTLHDQHPEEESNTLYGLWQVKPEDDAPSLFERTNFGQVDRMDLPSDAFSMNDEGAIAFLTADDDDQLWLRDESGTLQSIAREGHAAPNVADVGLSEGTLFQTVHNPALSNSGHLTFRAEVDGRRSVWISDGEEDTRPVAIEGMDAPGLGGMTFRYILPFSGSAAPLMNNQNQVVFWAKLDDGETSTSYDSIWLYDPCHGLSLIAAEGQSMEFEGLLELVGWQEDEPVWEPAGKEVREIDRLRVPQFSFNGRGYGPNMGLPSPLNDAGEFVYVVRLLGDFRAGQINVGDTGQLDLHDVLMHTRLPSCGAGEADL